MPTPPGSHEDERRPECVQWVALSWGVLSTQQVLAILFLYCIYLFNHLEKINIHTLSIYAMSPDRHW